MRKKIARIYQDKFGDGKKAIEDSEEDFSTEEVAEVLRRLPPSQTVNAFPLNEDGEKSHFEEGRVGPIKANGDETAEYILATADAANEIRAEDFTVPHREDMRGRKNLPFHNSWGSQVVTTGDTTFNYEVEVVIEDGTETVYGDEVPQGVYSIEISSDSIDDETMDAALGNIESRSETVNLSQEELIDYLEGQEGELMGEDINSDSAANAALRKGWDVYADNVLDGGNGDEAAEFIEQFSEEYGDQQWSGVLYETDSGNTGIWRLSIPGSKDATEGSRPWINGEIQQSYDETINQLG